MIEKPKSCFIFGYGSLMWNPGFHFIRSFEAIALNQQRRFWQMSPDHRGTEESPGIVVTLDSKPSEFCFGVCYEVETSNSEIFDYLDHREKGGYSCLDIQVQPIAGGENVSAMCYIGLPGNPYYLGQTPENQIAAVIEKSIGPSGPNIEYFENVYRYLRDKNREESHILEIGRFLSF